MDTRISALTVADSKPMAQRWFYRQRIVAEFTRSERPWIMLLEAGIAPAWQGPPATVQMERVEVPTDPAWDRTQVQGTEAASLGEQTIRPDADLLFVAGAGWTKKQADGQVHATEAEELIRIFLQRSGASLGSSKSLVDQTGEGGQVLSLLTHLNQVGQTGSSPRHPKGLATCCHGEEPHVVGWRFITERRAVNLDPNCGWAQGKADVLYVADAFEVMRKLNELLASR
jgi:electron transfer flavoprotein alpha subunit